MKFVYQAGTRSKNDGLCDYTAGAIFSTKAEAEKLYGEDGISKEVVVFDTVLEFNKQLATEEKRKARMALIKAGFTDNEARRLVP